ncbi:MAG: hypothetical protein HYX67_11065 [Candidatus Melainabacteria bacterium]|nr:hypothetical protein [Candidatus Melainabacteria bacterium]
MTYDKENYRQYWKDRASELISINHAIWGFVGAAALIDHGTKLANNGETGRQRYKDFVKTFGDKYRDFTFKGGTKDLDVQVYHTFRCGLLHSFSLVADNQGQDAGARSDSIVLAATKDGAPGALHCTNYTDYGKDACLLVLEPFVEDIGNAIDRLFDDAALDESIKKTYESNPPFNAFASTTIAP